MAALTFNFLIQPDPTITPPAIGRADGNTKNLSSLLRGQANEITEFDQLCHLLVVRGEFLQRVMDCNPRN